MTPELIDSYTKLGIAALLAGCLCYVFIFYIRITAKQRDKDHEIHGGYIKILEGVRGALDKVADTAEKGTLATQANTIVTHETKEAMQGVNSAIREHNDFVKDYARSRNFAAGGGSDDVDDETSITPLL